MFTYKNTIQKRFSFESYENKLQKEFNYLLKYFDLNSNRVETTIDKLEYSLNQEIEEKPEEQTRVNDLYETQLRSINSFYYHSSITLVHSFFENQLFQLSKLIQEKTKSKLDISSLNGRDYIKSGLNYLKLTTGLSEDLLNKHKPRLGQFQQLRNKIIHDNSTYKDEQDKKKLLNDFGKNIEFYDVENKFYLKSDDLPKEYLEKSMALYRDILEHLRNIDFIVPTEINENITVDLPF
ncbi:hypothetical protein VH441_07730 [Psychrobacter sp. HD31]|uniref:hypothetical protein n=1 Tax=Psychrobacter sp. HD31 TaxID=3112003 RepID=UPI003DA584C8